MDDIDPRIAYTVLGVIAVLVIGLFVWKMRSPGFHPQTTGSEAMQQQYERTGTFYQPPANAPVPHPPPPQR